MNISIEHLEKITSISTLKVLLAFFKKYSSSQSVRFEYSLVDIATDSGVSVNSIRKSINELIELQFIQKDSREKYKRIYIFCLVEENKELPSGWKRATGARKKKEEEREPEDLFSINLYREDINSISVSNPNINLEEKDVGSLASRIMKEIFIPRSAIDPSQYRSAIPYQMKVLKDLLLQYRTEQVIAGIIYWTEVKPPRNGLVSLRFLAIKKNNNNSFMMEALDYYKSGYLKMASEIDREKLIEKVNVVKHESEQEQALQQQQAEHVAQMSNEDFVKNLLSGLGTIPNMLEKDE